MFATRMITLLSAALFSEMASMSALPCSLSGLRFQKSRGIRMSAGFFSKPRTLDDWFKLPAVISALVAGFLAVMAVVIGLPAAVLFASTGGGVDLMLCVLALIVFPAPGWLAFKNLSNGHMRKACLWGLLPLVLTGLIWVWLSGAGH